MSDFKAFWARRALRKEPSKNVGNLEGNDRLYQIKIAHEVQQVDKLFAMAPKQDKLLDLGSGEGFWSAHFAGRCKEVTAVDFSEDMLSIARDNNRTLNSDNNIRYLASAAEEFSSDDNFDVVFISGLIIYLEDQNLEQLIRNIDNYTTPGSTVLLRDGTAVNERYEVRDQYSEALQDNYSAIYRNKAEYIAAFKKAGFTLKKEQQMFPEGHELNKFPETRLWLYLFHKE